MSSLRRLVHEAHRRSLWQVVGIYLAVSWFVLQVVDALTETAGLPDWVPAFALVLLLIGFPIVVATAFIQEGGPGERREGQVEQLSVGAAAPLAPGTGVLDLPSTRPSFLRRHLTWKRAVMGGVVAFGGLGVAAGGYYALWSAGIGKVGSLVAQGVLEEGEAVILADFGGPLDGEGLGEVVTEALRVDLLESKVLRLLPPAYVGEALARTGRERDATLTAELAREIAIRDGFKALIAGEVSAVGGGYLLTASLVAAETGEVLAGFRVPAASENDLLSAIDRLSQDIRERAGESLRTIRQGTPLAQATTSSLEALRLYTRAVAVFDQGDLMGSIPPLEEAIALDPEFAMALRKLSVALSNAGMAPARVRETATRAYELRHRLSEREAGLAEAWYQDVVRNNDERVIEAYRRVLERYPNDPTALNNLGGRLMTIGRPAEAEVPLRVAVALPAPAANSFSNLIMALWNQGKTAEARQTLEEMRRLLPGAATVIRNSHWLAAGEGRWQEAHGLVLQQISAQPGNVNTQVFGRSEAAGYDVARGRAREAAEHLAAARRAALEAGSWSQYWNGPLFLEVMSRYLSEGQTGARAAVLAGLREVPLDSLDARSDARHTIASLLAVAGATQTADSVFGAWERSFALEERGLQYRRLKEQYVAFRARGTEDDAAAAAAFTRLYTEIVPCTPWCEFTAEFGRALDGAGGVDEAIARYEAHLANVPLSWHAYVAAWTPLVLERLAFLYEARGDIEKARTMYQRMADQFADADGPLAERARQARLKAAALAAPR